MAWTEVEDGNRVFDLLAADHVRNQSRLAGRDAGELVGRGVLFGVFGSHGVVHSSA